MKNGVFWDIKNPVRTSQETHYISATELSRLMLCNILGFHGGDYEVLLSGGGMNSICDSIMCERK
jgi:hypothetical protein